MTPAARLQAAIEILDDILSGTAAEPALQRWGRRSRYAGSKDRRAVRDEVFSALRQKRSRAYVGGSETGRGLVLGGLYLEGIDPREIFGSSPYAPKALSAEETARDLTTAPHSVCLDCPDWLMHPLQDSLGDARDAVLALMQQRAPIGLRVHARKSDLRAVAKRLAADGFDVAQITDASCALVVQSARGLERHPLFLEGVFEFQDVGAQKLCDNLPIKDGMRILDYCAGGGGKSLAVSASHRVDMVAHDIRAERLKQITDRANRAGDRITLSAPHAVQGQFDGVILDVPCSGTGAWRRQVEAKWSLTPERLAQLQTIQVQLLTDILPFLKEGAWVAYMTCSMLRSENQDVIAAASQYALDHEDVIVPSKHSDGFYYALLRKKT